MTEECLLFYRGNSLMELHYLFPTQFNRLHLRPIPPKESHAFFVIDKKDDRGNNNYEKKNERDCER